VGSRGCCGLPGRTAGAVGGRPGETARQAFGVSQAIAGARGCERDASTAPQGKTRTAAQWVADKDDARRAEHWPAVGGDDLQRLRSRRQSTAATPDCSAARARSERPASRPQTPDTAVFEQPQRPGLLGPRRSMSPVPVGRHARQLTVLSGSNPFTTDKATLQAPDPSVGARHAHSAALAMPTQRLPQPPRPCPGLRAPCR